jgi:hypothetical protein
LGGWVVGLLVKSKPRHHFALKVVREGGEEHIVPGVGDGGVGGGAGNQRDFVPLGHLRDPDGIAGEVGPNYRRDLVLGDEFFGDLLGAVWVVVVALDEQFEGDAEDAALLVHLSDGELGTVLSGNLAWQFDDHADFDGRWPAARGDKLLDLVTTEQGTDEHHCHHTE